MQNNARTFVNGRESVSAQCLSFVRAGEVRETMKDRLMFAHRCEVHDALSKARHVCEHRRTVSRQCPSSGRMP